MSILGFLLGGGLLLGAGAVICWAAAALICAIPAALIRGAARAMKEEGENSGK